MCQMIFSSTFSFFTCLHLMYYLFDRPKTIVEFPVIDKF